MQDIFDTKNEIYAMKRKALGGAINQLFNTAKTDSKIVGPLVKLVAPLGLNLSVYEDEDPTKTLWENIAKNPSLKNLNKVMKDLPLINVVKIGNIISELLVGKRDATKALANRTVAVNYFIAAVTELNEYFAAIGVDYILPLPNLTKRYKRPVGVDEAIRVKPKRKKKSLLGEAVPNDTVTLETTIDPIVEANPEVVIPKISSRNRVTNNKKREPITIKQKVQVEKINIDPVMVITDEPLPEIVKEETISKSIDNGKIIEEPQSNRIILLNSFLVGKKETGEPARTMSSLAKKCESDEEFFNKITTTSYRKHITKKFFDLHKDLFLSYNPNSEEIIFRKSKKDKTESKEMIHPNQGSFEFEPDDETKKMIDQLKPLNAEYMAPLVNKVRGTYDLLYIIDDYPFIIEEPVTFKEKVKTVFSKIFRLK
jgi:hypothetical protein